MARIEKWDEVHGNQAPDERMMAFLDSATDQYAILQLRRIEDTVYERFSSMRELKRMGLEPDIDHYEVVYTAPLLPYKDQNTMLEELYAKFNVSRPDDFTGHTRPREYDGSHIRFGGMNPEIRLREHQQNAIAHPKRVSVGFMRNRRLSTGFSVVTIFRAKMTRMH